MLCCCVIFLFVHLVRLFREAVETLKILGESGAATFGKGLGSVAVSEESYSQVIRSFQKVLTVAFN